MALVAVAITRDWRAGAAVLGGGLLVATSFLSIRGGVEEIANHRRAGRAVLKVAGRSIEERGTFNASSVHACLRSWRKLLPVADANIRLLFENDPSPLPWASSRGSILAPRCTGSWNQCTTWRGRGGGPPPLRARQELNGDFRSNVTQTRSCSVWFGSAGLTRKTSSR